MTMKTTTQNPMETKTRTSIFIVEDDEHFRETFIDAMSLKGIDVEGVRSGTEALKALRVKLPSVIIVDVRLPDIHGFELVRCLRKSDRLNGVPIIFLSASSQYNDPRDRVEGFLAGADVFLAKPITMEYLASEIEKILRTKR